MDPSCAQHHQAMGLEEVVACNKAQQQDQRRLIRPQPEHLKCPRCDSSNTKFCYYNNYSLSQPRYFCKACRRYWTKGGSLRNVPVGGGCRKNKRCSSSSSSSKKDQLLSTNSNPLPTFPSLTYDSNDLTLAFGGLINKQPTRQLRLDDHDGSILGNFSIGNPNITTSTTTPNFLDALRSGFLDAPHNGFHNFYYGYGHGNMGEVDQCGGGGGRGATPAPPPTGGHEEIVLPYEDMSGGGGGDGATQTPTTAATITTTTKQEVYNSDENRLFMNFPWHHQYGGGEGNMGNVDSGRECWNGLGSSWPGLVNSSLM